MNVWKFLWNRGRNIIIIVDNNIHFYRCLVNFVDKKREKQRKTDEEWFTEKGSQFSRPNAHGGMFGSTTGLNKVRGAATKTGLAAARENWRSAEEKITGRR